LCIKQQVSHRILNSEHRIKMNNRKFKIAKGFTLAESMIAMTILAVATAGVILPFSGGSAIHSDSAKRTIAVRLASDMLEEINNSDFDDIIANYDGHFQWPGTITDATGAVITNPDAANLSRTVFCNPATVAGVPLIWATVYIHEGGYELLRLNMLIGS